MSSRSRGKIRVGKRQTEVEVRFTADGAGTRIELEHRGWEAGPIMQKQGQGYSDGWGIILEKFGAQANAA